MEESTLREQATLLRRQLEDKARARVAHYRMQQGKADPEPFAHRDPPLTKDEKKTQAAAEALFNRYPDKDFGAAMLAEYVQHARLSADVDATTFREGYFPHIFFGNFAVVRILGDPAKPDSATATRLSPAWGQSGFDTLEEAREAAHEDWKKAQESGEPLPDYRITSVKFQRETWRRLTPGESRRTHDALAQLSRGVSGRALEGVLEELGDGIDIDRKTLEKIGRDAANGWTPHILQRYLSGEAEKRVLSSLRRRSGEKGYGTDIVRTLHAHADSIGNHIRSDRIYSMATRILHREGTLFPYEGRYTDRAHPKDNTDLQKAFRTWAWDAMYVQQGLNRRLNREYFAKQLLGPIKPGSAADTIAKAALLYTTVHFATAWATSRQGTSLLHGAFGALYGIAVGSLAVARGGGDIAENVSAEDVRLQVWFKLGMQPLYLAYAAMNATQTFVTVPALIGWEAWARGYARYSAYVSKTMPDDERQEIDAALERAGVASQAERTFFDTLGGSRGGNEAVGKAVKFMGAPGLFVERHNRIFTFIAARELALRHGRKSAAELEARSERLRQQHRLSAARRLLLDATDPEKSADAFAEQAMSKTQFDTTMANRARLLRQTAPVVRDAFLFKNFQWQMAGATWNSLLGNEKQLGEQIRTPEGRRTFANRVGAFGAMQIPLVLFAGRIGSHIGMAQFTYAWLSSLLGDEDDDIPITAVRERTRRVGLGMTADALEVAEDPRQTWRRQVELAWTWGLPALFGLSGTRSVGYRDILPGPGGLRTDSPGALSEALLVSAPGLMSLQRAAERAQEGEWGGAAGSISPALGRVIYSFAEDTRTATGLLVHEGRDGTLDFLRQFTGLPSMPEQIRAERRMLEALVKADRSKFSAAIRAQLRRRLQAGEKYDDLEKRWYAVGRDHFSRVVQAEREKLRDR